jgi:hypothetical protein
MDYLPEPAVPVKHAKTVGGCVFFRADGPKTHLTASSLVDQTKLTLAPFRNAAFHNFHNDFSHISDANLRRRLVLRECDNIPFGW